MVAAVDRITVAGGIGPMAANSTAGPCSSIMIAMIVSFVVVIVLIGNSQWGNTSSRMHMLHARALRYARSVVAACV